MGVVLAAGFMSGWGTEAMGDSAVLYLLGVK